MKRRCIMPALLVLLGAVSVAAAEAPLVRVTFRDDGTGERTLEGKIVVEAEDGGLLVMARDGRLSSVTPERLIGREMTGAAFQPLSAEELGSRLQRELGEGFEIVRTRHYIICSNAGRRYARWCGSLFERLMSAFRRHWRSRDLDLHDPKLPLAAIVFANEKQFAAYAAEDVGPAAADSKGYYSIRTNRMVLYDLTAGDGSGATRRGSLSLREIQERMAAAGFNVATVVHEATHQIAFNCGMHGRYADNPVWLTEGMAMYFETPDLKSRTGWRTVGRVNRPRLKRFREYLAGRRKPNSLQTLLSTDKRFRSAETAEDAYAEAWALSYFLIKTRREQYIEYLNRLGRKPVLVWDDAEERLRDFQAAFGDDLEALDRQFLRYMARAR